MTFSKLKRKITKKRNLEKHILNPLHMDHNEWVTE